MIDAPNETPIPADGLRDGNEEIIGLLVERGEGFQKDPAISAGPKRPVHVIRLQLQLGEIPLLDLPLALPIHKFHNYQQKNNQQIHPRKRLFSTYRIPSRESSSKSLP